MTRLAPHERPEVERPDDVDANAIMTVLRVPKEMAGMRVDVFVQTQLKDTSRTRAKQIVKVAARTLQGAHLRPNARVAAGVKNENAYRSASTSNVRGVTRSSRNATSTSAGVTAAMLAMPSEGPPRYSLHGTHSNSSGCDWACRSKPG